MSQDFRAPLSSVLMLLESLLQMMLDEVQKQIVDIVIQQINLLVCLVNDLLDMKLIEQGSFEKKRVVFDPLNTFNFVRSIFLTQA